MIPIEPPVALSISFTRKWSLYAFPAGCTPTDERGLLLGLEELGQIVETQVRHLHDALDVALKELETARAELALLREANVERLHAETIASMERK